MIRWRGVAKVLGIAGLIAFGILLWPNLAISPVAAMSRNVVWHGPYDSGAVTLTFDDGPDPVYTPQVLKLLAENNIHATFFLVGERARKHPELVAAIRAGGHEIGNHTDSWARTWPMPLDEFEKDLQQAETSLNLVSQPRKFFRPAGGIARPSQVAAAKRKGYTVVIASAYGYDPHIHSASFIAWEIGRSLGPGSIVVLHDSGGNRQASVDALPGVIQAARSQRLKFVPLSELLAAGN
jgi:peptidoglycan/xylan/chitin deacetylase (PgdA/CDA1 family)